MCHANYKKRETTNDGWNQSIINQKARRKANLQILGNIGSEHKETCRDEKKIEKRVYQKNEKLLETKIQKGNLIKDMDN